jgi:2,3-bisphosphoglycerate-independent phosphoglycerate mutase
MEESYARGDGDEFVKPTVVVNGDGAPVGPVRDGDAVIFFNFRADRAREIGRAFTEPGFGEFERKAAPRLSAFVCMTEYDKTFALPVAFPPADLTEIFPEIVSRAGLRQLRCAETEKYAHVTFFFNGGRETVYPNEDRILVPSPRDVKTYDHKPEMSAREVTDKLVEAIGTGRYGFILVNYANPDMVGHTGVLPAAVKAVETVDSCLARVVEAVLERDGDVLITADHGNCEQMVDPATGEPHTAHTTNPVPVWWATRHARGRTLRDGGLADVAPTLLELLELPVPPEMTGRSLLVREA